MKKIESTPLAMILSVVVTCTVAATALTSTYSVTHELIIEQERAAEEAAVRAVLPDAEAFSAIDEDALAQADEAAGETPVGAVYIADNSSGESIGYAVRVAPRGYGGPMNIIVGLDRDGLVTGVSIITMNETPGLGTKVQTEAFFLEQFAGWDGADIDTAAKEFDAVTGATKSSSGIRKGVLAAGHVYAEILGAEGGTGQ